MQVCAQMQSSPAATTTGSTSGQDAQDNVRAVVTESWLARHRARRQGEGPVVITWQATRRALGGIVTAGLHLGIDYDDIAM